MAKFAVYLLFDSNKAKFDRWEQTEDRHTFYYKDTEVAKEFLSEPTLGTRRFYPLLLLRAIEFVEADNTYQALEVARGRCPYHIEEAFSVRIPEQILGA